MAETPRYRIEDIIESNSETHTAFTNIMGLTERVTQYNMPIDIKIDPYSGPHYALEDGLAIVQKYQLIVVNNDSEMVTAFRVASHWENGYETISRQEFWSGE